MEVDEFIVAAREAFASASNESVKLTVTADYVEFVRGVGVVANVSAYITDPWQYTFGEVVLLKRGEDAAARLEHLRAKLDALADLDTATAATAHKRITTYLDLPSAGSFPSGTNVAVRRKSGGQATLARGDDEARREAAIADAMAKFDGVAAKMREVYGYPLPKHVALWHALVESLNPIEARGLEAVGRRPGGIMVWFEDGGLEREPRDGLDGRLDCRFRCDPAELVTTMWGDSDGLHLGLWYDDPDELPSFVAGNWARDSAETGQYEATNLKTLLQAIRQRAEWGDEELPFTVGALEAAVRWFVDREDELGEAEPRWAAQAHPNLLGGIGCALPAYAGDPRDSYPLVDGRYQSYRERSPVVSEWISEAREELADGAPAFAMTLGRELWWFDSDDYREVATQLLVDAYVALGRTKLAEIVQLHTDHRDMPSVAVY